MSAERVDCVVIGAGVIGLAIARALALSGREVLILEAAETFGSEISSRNSEVIHAGIYYPAGSLKARLCIAGKKALYRYCRERGVAHAPCGKLIVASEAAQLAKLPELRRKAAENGVGDLVFLDTRELAVREPELRALGALWSPSTGILDSHALMLAYLGDAETGGAVLVCRSPVTAGRVAGDGIYLEIGGEAGGFALKARSLVNAAGLRAAALASRLEGLAAETIPPIHFAKGCYFTLSGRSPFHTLIYPVHRDDASLGVHLTHDLTGAARFGPDVEWLEGETFDYSVDPARAAAFYTAVRHYWPGLPDGALQPGYAGIRPKLQAPGAPMRDFLIQGEREHGVPGLVNLYGIESPGLTASLAIGDLVADLLKPAGVAGRERRRAPV